MRFQFPLEELLHIRRMLEQQARERLESAMARIRALETSLSHAQQWSDNAARICSSKKRLPAIEVQFVDSVRRQTREAITHGQQQKQNGELRAAELRAVYLLARRERKTVSTLRENAFRQFQIEQSRRQQSEMDENFLGKLLHSRNSAQQTSADARTEENQ